MHQFNGYLGQVNQFVSESQELSKHIRAILSRTIDVEKIATNADKRLTESQELLKFLSSHFAVLDQRKYEVSQMTISVDQVLSKAFEELQAHTQAKVDAIKDIMIKEEDLLRKELSANRYGLSKLSLLDDLNKGMQKANNENYQGLLAEVQQSNKYLEELERHFTVKRDGAAKRIWNSLIQTPAERKRIKKNKDGNTK